MISHPLVSVSIITYNHEKYIAQAIDSVLEQQTDFEIEIIIGDDYSSDNTREIIEEYQQKFPKTIHLILHPQRYAGIPGRLNNITNIYACRGKYIALLDGDDYWTDTGKLQSQVDFMDANEDYVAIANEAKKVTEDNTFTGEYYSGRHTILKTDNSFSHENLLKAGWCLTQTSSLLFRNKTFAEFPDWFWNIISADYCLLLLLSQYGKIKYLKKPYTAYRIHGDSFMSKHFFSKKSLSITVKELQLLRKLFLPYRLNSRFIKNIRISSTINTRIATFKYAYASYIKREGNLSGAIGYLIKASFTNFSYIYFLDKALTKMKNQD